MIPQTQKEGATEVTAPSPTTTQRSSVAGSVSDEDKQARNARAIAAFHMTLLLDDIVGAVREKRALARQREADGNPAEVDA